ncbi:MAG: glycosyltransferase [Acidobacteria bacterium]|nr:glycosyltransferase [Acidobacteriota bacterium]
MAVMKQGADHSLLIVGNPEPIQVGAHLLQAARDLGLSVDFCDCNIAFAAPWPLAKLNWWFRGHRPARLDDFSRQVIEACQTLQPKWVISTGISPVADWAIKAIGKLGTQLFNFLTDDPWNPAHRAPWFMDALPFYDHVFSPRRANLKDLRCLGCRQVSYLPFAYAPEAHFAEPPVTDKEKERFGADIVFVGGADHERIPYISALSRAGFNIALYGGYWKRFPESRAHNRGHADLQTSRKAIGGAKIALCLVRRANRDGHSMRTFEVPAIGACMLVEDTEEHREIFGAEGKAVIYFNHIEQMIEKARWLRESGGERQRLAESLHHVITSGKHTYRDRLASMLFPAN